MSLYVQRLCEDCDGVNRAKNHPLSDATAHLSLWPTPFKKQDGYFNTGWKYLHANLYRFFIGEIRDNKIRYQFGHYHIQKKNSVGGQRYFAGF